MFFFGFKNNKLGSDFDTYVGNLISKFLSSDEEIVKNNTFDNMMYVSDYYLPNGCEKLKWKGKTVIEIKLGIRYPLIDRLYEEALRLISKKLIDNFVIIYYENTEHINIEDYVEPFNIKEFKILNYKILEDEALNSKLVEKTFEYYVKTTDKPIKQESIIIDRKQGRLESARRTFKNNNYSMFLGAGLSMDAKLPSWSQLLESLLERKDDKPFNNVNQANSNSISESFGHSSIITGRYVFDGYKDAIRRENSTYTEQQLEDLTNKIFIERIREALYKREKYTSSLINSVAGAIKKKAPMQIITYNFDDLLETKLNDKNKYRSVFNNEIPRSNCVPIYHVHGMVANEEGIPSSLVLSEKEYHKLYSNPYNWANVIQLHALNSTSCFFIGFSMTDPNQRRLLEIAKTEGGFHNKLDKELPHYVFLKKDPLKGEASLEVNKEHWLEIENMMSDFGLNVIWFKDFNEIPKMIDFISGKRKEKPEEHII